MTRTLSLPASWYRDPATYEAERHAVFARSWQLVARATDLGRAGDYVTATVAGWPLVVVRGDDGRVRAFHDVCMHRGGPLVAPGEPAGNVGSAFVCGYHGWTYDLGGALVRARDFGAEPDCSGLREVRCDAWRGLVFVDVSGQSPPLDRELAGLDAACAPFALEDLVFDQQVVHEVRCNWKTYVDNYLEGYHIPIVHPDLDREIDSRRYEVVVHEADRLVEHRAPARDGAATVGVWLWQHPNLAVNVYPDGMNVERMLPAGHDRTLVVYWYFFAPGAEAADEARKLSAQLLDEDRRICEAVQRNLDAGVYERGELSPRHEAGVAAFQRWVREAVDPGEITVRSAPLER